MQIDLGEKRCKIDEGETMLGLEYKDHKTRNGRAETQGKSEEVN